MGTYSDIEIKVLERLTEVIDNELSSIQLDHADRDRMLYSTCIDDLEKTNLTKKEIKKMQKKIAKCPPNIAGYVSALLSPYDLHMHNGDYYDFRNILCRNFINDYPESIEEIAKEYISVTKVEEEDEMYFESVLNDDLYEFDKKEIEGFIKYMAIAERLSIFKTILEEVTKEDKKTELDIILDKMKAKADERESKKINDELSKTLDNLRGQLISSLQLYNIIKDNTNLEKDALEYLKEDIGWYLFSMKTAQEIFYTEEEVERAYKKIEKKHTKEEQLELGYLKKTKFFFEEEYEDPEEPIYIDKEKLLFPNEFTSIKELLEIINKELDKIELAGKENQINNTESDMYSQFKNDINEDVLIVEELENRLAIEAVVYKQKCDNEWETYKFDPQYFDAFISDALYSEFVKSIYERIKPLNDFEINKYLTLSVNQFKTHTPIKRAEAFKINYQSTYWFPNVMEYKEESYDTKYSMHVWRHYTKHFHLFKEATENVLQDFKNGLISSGKKEEIIVKPKVKSKTKYHSFTYKNINTGLSQLTDLMNALKRKVLIADDTELAVFRKVFSGVSIENPIVWKGNISELSYFIKQLHNELKYVEDLKQQQWVVTINCFIQENGEQYNRKKLRTQKVPSTSKHIDLALKTLK